MNKSILITALMLSAAIMGCDETEPVQTKEGDTIVNNITNAKVCYPTEQINYDESGKEIGREIYNYSGLQATVVSSDNPSEIIKRVTYDDLGNILEYIQYYQGKVLIHYKMKYKCE